MKKIIVILTAFFLLTSCGKPESAEAIAATITTTAVTFEMSTEGATTAEIISKTTSEFARENYEVDFPVEFSENYSFRNDTKPLSEEDYLTEVSPNAEKLFSDYLSFATENMNAGELRYPEYPPYYYNGHFDNYPAGRTFFGLVDINNDGVPEIFKYFTYGDLSECNIYFYDLYTKTQLTKEEIHGFDLREGVTYFGKNKDGNVLICAGSKHSNYVGYIEIAELLFDKDTEKLAYNESFRANFGLLDNIFYCSSYSINGVRVGADRGIPAAEFEAAYREFYDAIDFDVYWICGDILYHGAEETEYKGKMAYEKYLEFTKMQKYLDEKLSYTNNLLIDDLNNDGISDAVLVYDSDTIFAYYRNGEIKKLSANANWGGECECENGAPLYYNKNTNEFLTESTASRYKNYSFYCFSDGEYKLQDEYIWREIIDVWDVEKWADFPNIEYFLEQENLTFEDLKKLDEGELLGYAWVIGTFDRVNQYTVNDKEVTEAEWRKAIDDFINADSCYLLCPDNTDLDWHDYQLS
jgi:hypothetical protein